jgi:hypothetical protein
MIAFMKESRMSQRIGNRRRFALDLCGPYACDEMEDTRVPCYLEIAGANVAVEIPSRLIEQHRLRGAGGIVLHLPGERLPLITSPAKLSETEQKAANGWLAEMEDFDRF